MLIQQLVRIPSPPKRTLCTNYAASLAIERCHATILSKLPGIFSGLFCSRLQPVTILIGLIAALTRFSLSLHYDDYIIGSGISGCFINNLSQLLIYDESQGFQNKPSGVGIDPYKVI